MATMTSGYQPQGGAQNAQDQFTPPRADLIPLVCFICPKNSHFSDLSHLLTHISSKGHLHNMFQLNLSRDVDANAELALAEFESWYKQNDISALLRARKTAREQRDNQQRRSQTSSSFGVDTALASRQSVRGGRSNRRSRGSGQKLRARYRDEGIDELNGDVVKFESDDEVENKHEYHSATHAPYVWHSASPYPNSASQYANNPSCQFQDYLEDEDDSSKYEPSEIYSPFPPEDTPDTVEDDTGALILKGVVYPGMAGFDSATEKDRRMRNQKKDPAVLLKLEANSQLVTRVEEVLNTNLDYQRTRDVYDEPSVDGSEDENDAAVNETRTKRRAKAKSSYTSIKRRANTRSRQQAQSTGRTRVARSSTRRSRGASLSNIAQSTMPTRRITRSSTNRHEQLPLHSHGIHPDVVSLRDGNNELDDDEGSQTYHGLIGQCLMIPRQISEPIFTLPSQEHYDDSTRRHERLPGLALRPGNPNAGFASPTSNYKKSPPRYSGKENSHLLIKSPSSFNSYLHPSGDSMDPSNYNPLCPQPRDGFDYRLYSPYDEEPKSATSSGFNPINGSSNYDPAHMPSMMGNPYHRSQPGGEDYPL
ncbi:hypothetical protein E0Z10_g2879 [Xylaria hypoxylon]|uniref:Uncharacterized protein n=1 Tax=Xylaria hypoxylon TaxID=37992 RepID=A0A4Z0YNH2_9PEZI|nr:hypothetical protein E0Z10_g2879 [Xylaria hypoxylon]